MPEPNQFFAFAFKSFLIESLKERRIKFCNLSQGETLSVMSKHRPKI